MKNIISSIYNIKSYVFTLGFFIMIAFTSDVSASHYRFGNISWTPGTGNTINFTVQQAWRSSAFGNPTVGTIVSTESLNMGDGNFVTISLTVLSVNVPEDWFFGEYTFTYTYAAPGNYTVYYESCCRISGMQNNGDGSYRVETIANVGSGNSAPLVTVPIILNMPQGQPGATYQIFAVDPNGDNIQFRFATVAEGQGTQPSGLTVSSSGLLTFNTTATTIGQIYSTIIVVEDLDGSNNVKTKIMADFIIKMIDPNIAPPVFGVNAPAEGSILNASCSQPFTFSIDATGVGTLTIAAVGVPLGSTFTPPLPVSGAQSVASVFNWTPTSSNVGLNLMSIIVTDNTGPQTTRNFGILVVDNTVDMDGDTFTPCSGDCDETNAAINPGATEICDGIDNDCDGDIDEGLFTTYYTDVDGDLYGVTSTAQNLCTNPGAGYATQGGDCDDTNMAVNPGAPEILGNGIDDNCDGLVDILPYCQPTISDPCTYMFLTNVTLGSINNNTACTPGGYTNYSSQTTSVTPGDMYTFSVIGGGSYNQYTMVFVDWNNDGDFLDAGETVISGLYTYYYQPNSTSFIVPANATAGNYRMRVVSDYDFNGFPNSCGTVYGEVEDYTLNVVGCTYPDFTFTGQNVNNPSDPTLPDNWLDNCMPPLNDPNINITIMNGSIFVGMGTIIGDIINNGTLKGTFTLQGNLNNNGIFSPGN